MITPQEPVVEVIQGREIVDPYRWLEDEADPRVVAWTEAQNARTRGVLDAFPGRARIHERLRQLLEIGHVGTPFVRRERYFISRRDGGQNHAVIHVRDGLQGEERIVLDPNTWSEDGTVSLDWYYPDRDGRRIAYGRSESGDERSTLFVLDVDSGELLSDTIPDTRACSLAWLPDGCGFYYTRYPATGTPDDSYNRRIFFHALGSDPASDPLVYGADREKTDWPNVDLSWEGDWMWIGVDVGWTRTDAYVFDRERPDEKPIVISEGVEAQFGGDILGDTLYLLTNEGAPRFRIYKIDLRSPERECWLEIVAEHPMRVLESFCIVGGRLFVMWMERASSRLEVFDLDGRFQHEVPLPTLGSLAGVSGEWDGHELFFGFTSFTMPPTVYRCEVGEEVGPPLLHLDVKADLDPHRYQVGQVAYTSKDGTPVTMFLVHRRGLQLDGTAPCLLTGYGGFNVSMTPSFARNTFLWLEHGGVYALPNLRGGGEYGEDWHRGGMLGNKQNVFDDFIAAAEFLIEQRYTSPARLAISGGSNGGLLMGAMITQRPELFKAVVCSVPLLDMLRYHLFRIAQLWIPEYGSADDPEQFEWLHAYSPYHRVADGRAYPAILIETGASDSRVDPLHARKMAARLQGATSGGPVLLRVESKAGHGAGKPLTKILEEYTDMWCFLFEQLEIEA